jgi:hypothetical protein
MGHVKMGDEAGTLDRSTGYIHIKINGKIYQAHRIAHLLMTGQWPEGNPEHENRIRHDNRWSNIKDIAPTQSENGGNRSLSNTNNSGMKGVCWHKQAKKWMSYIGVEGRDIYLGRFVDLRLAGLHYDAAAKLAWGLRFSCLNFPSEESDHIVLSDRVLVRLRGI